AHGKSWRSLVQNGNTQTALVRPGIALYGYSLPFVTAAGASSPIAELPLRPVLSWKTRIVDIREVGAGQGIGYNRAHVTSAPAKVATLAVGYGDGLNRGLSNRGQVIVRGQLAPILGNVSMDVTTVDATHVSGCQIGDEVVLIGKQGEQQLTAWAMAQMLKTI